MNSMRSHTVYTALVSLFCVNLALTNVIASKIILVPFFPGMALSVADLTYPVTFLLTDIVTEIWGDRKANTMVYMGFAMSIFMLFVLQLALFWPAHTHWVVPQNDFGYASTGDYQNAFASVFRVSTHLVLGSMTAYLCGQLLDIRLFAMLKRWTGGKALWLRNNVSTISSQLVDTFVCGGIFLYSGLGMEWSVCVQIMLSSYAFKVVFALADTPFCYLGRALLRRYLQEEPLPAS